MATVTMAPGLPIPQSQPEASLNTLPDPRSHLPTPSISRSNSTSPHHPELSNEVAALSNKLIHAINHQTDLDDTLNETRQQLKAAQERLKQLEPMVQQHRSLVANGILVRQSDVDDELLRLKTALADERRQKARVENEKKGIEQELETLTTALFEEANQMVAAARRDSRKEREPLERRNEQLQAQLNDAELLLSSHQEQLAELKKAMQDLPAHRPDPDIETNASTAPSTPAVDNHDHMNRLFDALNLSSTTPGSDEIPPGPPTSFSYLIRPVLRTDVHAYEDFRSLLEMSRRSQPSSRVTSGTFSGLGIGNLANRDQYHVPDRVPSTSSTSSLSTSNIYHSSPSTPNLANSANSSNSARDTSVNGTPLKETSFYKRALLEDIEPTLRLDMAPGLSWLARRTVVGSMLEGKLIVEPTSSSARLYHPPCTLCGEQGRDQKHIRTHRFRTSDSETAQRYPLCNYCLDRVRASCDFLGFLRMIKDGHWRTDGVQAEAAAWEESVRLRERMFWSRIGGGVVPAFLRAPEQTSRSSVEEEKTASMLNDSQTSLGSQCAKSERPSPLAPEMTVEEIMQDVQETKTDAPLPSIHELETKRPTSPPTLYQDTKFRQPSALEKLDLCQANSERVSLNLIQSRPLGPIRTETKANTGKGSISKRAAMFERATQDTSSSQPQTISQDLMRARSPGNGRPPSPVIAVDTSVQPAQ